jgi:peroxiredoxin Q/BCP
MAPVTIATMQVELVYMPGAGIGGPAIQVVRATAVATFLMPALCSPLATAGEVVLYFYPKDGTSGCTLEAHNFQRDLPAYEARNAMVVGVSVDTTGSHKEFCAKQGLTFKLPSDDGKLSGDEKKVSAEYGSLRSILGYKIAARDTFPIDPRGRIAKVWTSAGPSMHSPEVLAALTAAEKK